MIVINTLMYLSIVNHSRGLLRFVKKLELVEALKNDYRTAELTPRPACDA